MKDMKLIFIEGDESNIDLKIAKLTATFKDDGVIIIGGAGEGRKILYPKHITEESIISIQSDDIPISELLKMFHQLQAQKSLNSMIENIRNTVIDIPEIHVTLPEETKSNFIPRKGENYQPWRNKKRK